MTTNKLTNPKDAIGSSKLPLHLFPSTAVAAGAAAFLYGALKYGRANWRVAGVRASIYNDALLRHINAWFEGENIDPDSGLPHLGHALACIAIMIDAQASGMLNDDRQFPGQYRAFMDSLTPHVERLKAELADSGAYHFTIADAPLLAANENEPKPANDNAAAGGPLCGAVECHGAGVCKFSKACPKNKPDMINTRYGWLPVSKGDQ